MSSRFWRRKLFLCPASRNKILMINVHNNHHFNFGLKTNELPPQTQKVDGRERNAIKSW